MGAEGRSCCADAERHRRAFRAPFARPIGHNDFDLCSEMRCVEGENRLSPGRYAVLTRRPALALPGWPVVRRRKRELSRHSGYANGNMHLTTSRGSHSGTDWAMLWDCKSARDRARAAPPAIKAKLRSQLRTFRRLHSLNGAQGATHHAHHDSQRCLYRLLPDDGGVRRGAAAARRNGGIVSAS